MVSLSQNKATRPIKQLSANNVLLQQFAAQDIYENGCQFIELSMLFSVIAPHFLVR